VFSSACFVFSSASCVMCCNNVLRCLDHRSCFLGSGIFKSQFFSLRVLIVGRWVYVSLLCFGSVFCVFGERVLIIVRSVF